MAERGVGLAGLATLMLPNVVDGGSPIMRMEYDEKCEEGGPRVELVFGDSDGAVRGKVRIYGETATYFREAARAMGARLAETYRAE
jgi:hypothetical protein